MPEKQSLEDLLNQVNQLLEKIKTYDKPLKDIGITEQVTLELLEKFTHHFEQLNALTFAQSDVDIESLQNKKYESISNKELMEKAQNVELATTKLYLQFALIPQKPKPKKAVDDSPEAKKRKASQKKMERKSGKKGWLPS